MAGISKIVAITLLLNMNIVVLTYEPTHEVFMFKCESETRTEQVCDYLSTHSVLRQDVDYYRSIATDSRYRDGYMVHKVVDIGRLKP